MNQSLDDFLSFLNRSLTPWHAAQEIQARLSSQGFIPLTEEASWKLERKKGYCLIKDGSLAVAVRLPKHQAKRATLIASHLDSPSLKLKPIADVGCPHQSSQFLTETYGSPLLHTWLDRDLAIAGRAITKTKGALSKSELVYLPDSPLFIPSLAPHLDRASLDKGLQINKQDHLRPIVSLSREKPLHLKDLLQKHLSFDELIAFDLFLVPLEKSAYVGAHREMIASARLDNLASAYASLHALLHTEASEDTMQIALFFDHEEIGSNTNLGAHSVFLDRLLDRLAFHEGIQGDDLYRFKANSWCVSADLAHGFHPNYADRFDAKNAPWLGDGIILKTNAQMRYATSATSATPLIEICQKKSIPMKTFASRSDIPSGSTIGSLLSAACGIATVDIGIASLAMHSIREIISAQDQLHLSTLLIEVLHDAPKS